MSWSRASGLEAAICIDNCFPKFLTASELSDVSSETATANLARLSFTIVCKYFDLTVPSLDNVFVLPIVIFSPILAISATRFSSTVCPFDILDFFKSSTLELTLLFKSLNSFTKFTKSSFLATKSVSQLTSINEICLSFSVTAITPSFASLDIFFEAFEIPLTLRISIALSISPSDSFIAKLQSLNPAPVNSLSFFTFSISLIS